MLDNFETNFEVIPVLDGYEPETPLPSDPRVRPIQLKENVGMRQAINIGVTAARGKYLMRSDEHCLFSKGFDKTILKDIKSNEIVTARRYQLDPVKWEIMQEIEPIDFERLIIGNDPKKFSSQRWTSRSKEKADVMIDENMAMQGSMWVMPKAWWASVIKELQTEGYGPHYQDSTEMQFKTWQAGGRLMLNKNAWYAHRHKSFPRTHHYPREKARMEWIYALSKWFPEYQKIRLKWGV
jgi:glycosyltransferase involved in cell wall biosynthesis